MKAGVIGATGMGGGETLRLLLSHPEVQEIVPTSRTWAKQPVENYFPNLRKNPGLERVSGRTFKELGENCEGVSDCDVVFCATETEVSSEIVPRLLALGTGTRLIDQSAFLRLRDLDAFKRFYPQVKSPPSRELLERTVYGLPEVYRQRIRGAGLVANPGCNSTAVILGLLPLARKGLLGDWATCLVMAGSSAAGREADEGSHHSLREGVFEPAGELGEHRHIPEVAQALMDASSSTVKLSLSIYRAGMVRGLYAVSIVDLGRDLEETEVRRAYLESYREEPFVRIVSRRSGRYRQPSTKGVVGTNYCDVGWALTGGQLLVHSALDNLLKGDAGQAVQNMNIMMGFGETAGLLASAQFP